MGRGLGVRESEGVTRLVSLPSSPLWSEPASPGMPGNWRMIPLHRPLQGTLCCGQVTGLLCQRDGAAADLDCPCRPALPA